MRPVVRLGVSVSECQVRQWMEQEKNAVLTKEGIRSARVFCVGRSTHGSWLIEADAANEWFKVSTGLPSKLREFKRQLELSFLFSE